MTISIIGYLGYLSKNLDKELKKFFLQHILKIDSTKFKENKFSH
jgi:hypothetical protein